MCQPITGLEKCQGERGREGGREGEREGEISDMKKARLLRRAALKILGTEHFREEKPVMPRIIEKWKRKETSELNSNNPYEWK